MVKTKYIGLTYPQFLDNKLCKSLWKRFYCSKHIHLFDEVLSCGTHYLHCDACEYQVLIEEYGEGYL